MDVRWCGRLVVNCAPNLATSISKQLMECAGSWVNHLNATPLSEVGNVEPSGVQALKNPNPLKDDEGWLCLLLLSCLIDRIWGRFNM